MFGQVLWSRINIRAKYILPKVLEFAESQTLEGEHELPKKSVCFELPM